MHYCIIHDDSSHPHQHIVVKRTSVYDRVVTNRNIITNCCAASLVCTMNAGAILDIHLISDTDKIDIAANDSVEPYTAVVTHDHIADDRGVWCYEYVGAELRVFIFYGEY